MEHMENSKFEQDVDQLFDEEFEFKPITKGLGFHHSIKDKKEVSYSLKQQQIDLKDTLEQRGKQLNRPVGQPSATSMGDLAPFYQEQKNEPVSLEINVTTEEIRISEPAVDVIEDASMILRFGAWLMDMIIINALFLIAFVSMMLTSNTPLSVIRELVMSVDLFITIIPIYAIFYIFYFSFFDKTSFSTPGKKMVGIRVVNLNDRNVSMLQALLRSIITVISVFTFGLITLLDAQSRLTDTKVVRRK